MNIFKKEQTKTENENKNEYASIRFTEMPPLEKFEPICPKKKRITEKEYLESLYPNLINKKNTELNEEEKEILEKALIDFRLTNHVKGHVLFHLSYAYNDVIEKKAKENFKINRIEIFHLCKEILQDEYEELEDSYPKEMEYFNKKYKPLLDDYHEKCSELNYSERPNFSDVVDISDFIKFIDKIKYYKSSIVSDKYFNIVNDILHMYGNDYFYQGFYKPTRDEIRNNPRYSSGHFKGYYFEYENYLKIKDLISFDIEKFMQKHKNDEKKKDFTTKIKKKYIDYLSITEGIFCH